MFWLYERSAWIRRCAGSSSKFSAKPVIAEANTRALKAGYAFGETTEMFHTTTAWRRPSWRPGTYRNITGNEATALGFVAASRLAKRELVYGSYPITPASDILHQLATYKNFGVKTFQAEDEIAAIGSAIGASYGGAMGMTASLRPGHCAEVGGHEPGRDGRAAAGGRQRPARRARRRACRPRPSRRTCCMAMFGRNSDSPVPDRRAGDAGRMLRLRRSRRGASRSST